MAFLTSMALGALVSVKAGNSFDVLKKLGQHFDASRDRAQKWASGMKTVAKGLAVAGAAGTALTAVLAASGHQAANFEQQMSTVGSVMLKSRAEISSMESVAKRLGATTVFTATQVGEGMELMARAGFNVVDIIGPNGQGGGIEGVLSAAAASGDDLASTAGNVSNVLKGMGLATGEATRVADVLALASSKTNSTIGSLGESMKNVSATARQFRIPLEQVVAGVALLQDVGLDASEAGSSMNTMLTRLATMSDKMKDKMTSMGITFMNTKGDMLPFTQVLENIAKATKQAGGNMAAAGLLADLFGMRGQRAAANLKDMITDGRLTDLAKQLEGADGAAKKMAELRLDNLKGQITLLGSAVEGFSIDSMMPLNKEFTEGIKLLSKFIGDITLGLQGNATNAAGHFGTGIKYVVDQIAALWKWGRETFLSMLPEGSDSMNTLARYAGMAAAAAIAVGVAITPVLLVGAALAGVAAAVIPAIAGIVSLGSAGITIGGAVSAAVAGVGSVLSMLGPIALVVGLAFAMVWARMQSGADSFTYIIWPMLQVAWTAIKNAVTELFGIFSRDGVNTKATWGDVINVFRVLGGVIGTIVAAVVMVVAAFAGAAVHIFGTFIHPIQVGFGDVLGGFLDLITGADTFKNSLTKIFLGLVKILVSPFTGALNVIMETLKSVAGSKVGAALLSKVGISAEQAVAFVEGVQAKLVMKEPDASNGLAKDPHDAAAVRAADAAAAAQSANPEINVNHKVEDNRTVKVEAPVSIDGREVGKAMGKASVEAKERSGGEVTAWQRRRIIEDGAVSTSGG